MSKRKLLQLVNEKHVNGWDDPRMPTLSAMRRRGFPAAAIRNMCDIIGVAKRENLIDLSLLEYCVRENLNQTADRIMAVLQPIKLIITNYPENQTEALDIENNPEAQPGNRKVPFCNTLWIEQEDFMINPPKKYFRLFPGGKVRLKGAYIIECTGYDADDNGLPHTLYATYLPNSKSGNDTSGINVKGTIHWVSAQHAITAEIRLYDRLFTVENPAAEEADFKQFINPNALEVLHECYIEPAAASAKPGTAYQFLRKGYFTLDPDTTPNHLVFNRTVTLKDTWAKEAVKE